MKSPGGRGSFATGGRLPDPEESAIRSLSRRIIRAPLVEVTATLCRVVRAEHLRRIPPEPLYYRGSERGARYSPRGGPAGLYLASDHPTAFAEIRDLIQGASGAPLPMTAFDPATLVYVDIRVGRVLDLTDGEIRRKLRVSRKAILAEWEEPMLEYIAGRGVMPLTQQIGLAAHITGAVRGILYPSARWKEGRCLVIFPDRLVAEDRVATYDSTGTFAREYR